MQQINYKVYNNNRKFDKNILNECYFVVRLQPRKE